MYDLQMRESDMGGDVFIETTHATYTEALNAAQSIITDCFLGKNGEMPDLSVWCSDAEEAMTRTEFSVEWTVVDEPGNDNSAYTETHLIIITPTTD